MDTLNEGKIGQATQKIGEGAMEMKDAAIARAAEVRNAVIDTSKTAYQKCCSETESYIHAKPYQSLLMALGVGVLAGLFLRK